MNSVSTGRRRTSQSEEAAPTESFSTGDKVKHAKFGEGVVVNYEGQGKQARVQVNFVNEGSKWLMIALAKLESVG